MCQLKFPLLYITIIPYCIILSVARWCVEYQISSLKLNFGWSFGGKTRQYGGNMWKYVCGISWLRGLPPAHRCLHSYSLTPAQVDLQGSHWLSPPISSQPGWPICSCGRCPSLCHLCAPQPYSEPGHSSVFHTGHTLPAEEAAIFKGLAVCERKKKRGGGHMFLFI